MNAIRIVLGDLFGGDATPWLANGDEVFVLTVDDDVIVNLCEDETASLVHLFSAPGYARPGALVAAPAMPEDDRDTPEVASKALVHEDSGIVMVVRTMPRQRFDGVRFPEELQRHVAACRAWSAALSPTPVESQ